MEGTAGERESMRRKKAKVERDGDELEGEQPAQQHLFAAGTFLIQTWTILGTHLFLFAFLTKKEVVFIHNSWDDMTFKH